MPAPGPLPDHPADPAWSRALLCAGAVLGFLTVAVGALAAHLPDAALAPGGRVFLRSAVEMQGWHVPALLCCGLLLRHQGDRWAERSLRAAGACFALGIAGFCVGLYGLAFLHATTLARVAPVGGSVLMLGWFLLLFGSIRSARR